MIIKNWKIEEFMLTKCIKNMGECLRRKLANALKEICSLEIIKVRKIQIKDTMSLRFLKSNKKNFKETTTLDKRLNKAF